MFSAQLLHQTDLALAFEILLKTSSNMRVLATTACSSSFFLSVRYLALAKSLTNWIKEASSWFICGDACWPCSSVGTSTIVGPFLVGSGPALFWVDGKARMSLDCSGGEFCREVCFGDLVGEVCGFDGEFWVFGGDGEVFMGDGVGLGGEDCDLGGEGGCSDGGGWGCWLDCGVEEDVGNRLVNT